MPNVVKVDNTSKAVYRPGKSQTAGLKEQTVAQAVISEAEVIRDDDKNNFHMSLFTSEDGKDWKFEMTRVVGDKAAMNRLLAMWHTNFGLQGYNTWWVVDGKRTSSFKQKPAEKVVRREAPEPETIDEPGRPLITAPLVAMIDDNDGGTQTGTLLELRAVELPKFRYERAKDTTDIDKAIAKWAQIYNVPVESFTVIDERAKAATKRAEVQEQYKKTGEIGKSAPKTTNPPTTPENYGVNTSVWRWTTCTGFAVTVASKRHVGYDVIEHTAHYEGVPAEGIEQQAIIEGVTDALVVAVENKLDRHASVVMERLAKEAETQEGEGEQEE